MVIMDYGHTKDYQEEDNILSFMGLASALQLLT